MMTAKELRGKPPPELSAMLQERRQRLSQLRTEAAVGSVKNVRELRLVRREIARLMTVLQHTPAGGGSHAIPTGVHPHA